MCSGYDAVPGRMGLMRIELLSDLHLEKGEDRAFDEQFAVLLPWQSAR
jgi:hypothetical protein